MRVPDRLRGIIGKNEIWKSFPGASRDEALRLSRAESVRLDALFAEAEKRIGGAEGETLVGISDAKLEEIARSYFIALERATPTMPFSSDERAMRKEAAEEEALTIGQSLDDPGLQAIARSVGLSYHVPVQVEGRDFGRLVEAVQRALVEHYSREADRADLAEERPYDPLFVGLSKTSSEPAPSLTVAQAVKQFKAAPERKNVAPKTRAAYEFRYAVIVELLGADKPITDITRADMRSVRDTLLKLPPNGAKRYPGLPLQRVAERAAKDGVSPMSPKNARMYLQAANALFRWLVREELCPKNPASGIEGLPPNAVVTRRGFTVDELNKLFSASPFAASDGRGWLYWLPRLALFTGARFAELLALRADDLCERDGVYVLSIAPTNDRPLKTKGSRRLVPIHPELQNLGLIDHAKALPKGGMLFPDALGPKHMITARDKEIGRKLRSVLPDRSLVFHSFRHTFKDAAQRARISREHLAALGGWQLDGGKSAIDQYGRDPLVSVLAEEISRVVYPGLAL